MRLRNLLISAVGFGTAVAIIPSLSAQTNPGTTQIAEKLTLSGLSFRVGPAFKVAGGVTGTPGTAKPDSPLIAYKDASSGILRAYFAWGDTWRMTGPDFEHLVMDTIDAGVDAGSKPRAVLCHSVPDGGLSDCLPDGGPADGGTCCSFDPATADLMAVQVHIDNVVRGWYHAEQPWPPNPDGGVWGGYDRTKSIASSVAWYNDGTRFDKLPTAMTSTPVPNQVIRSPGGGVPIVPGEGDFSIVRGGDGFFYMFFSHTGFTGVARLPVADNWYPGGPENWLRWNRSTAGFTDPGLDSTFDVTTASDQNASALNYYALGDSDAGLDGGLGDVQRYRLGSSATGYSGLSSIVGITTGFSASSGIAIIGQNNSSDASFDTCTWNVDAGVCNGAGTAACPTPGDSEYPFNFYNDGGQRNSTNGLNVAFSSSVVGHFTQMTEPILFSPQTNQSRDGRCTFAGEKIGAVSMISPDGSSNWTLGTNPGDVSFYLFYNYVPQNADGFVETYMVGRRVEVNQGNPAGAPQVKVALSSYRYLSAHSYWETTSFVNNSNYSLQKTIGYLFTKEQPGMVPIYECYGQYSGTYVMGDHMLATHNCFYDGIPVLRKAGWAWAQAHTGAIPLRRCYSSSADEHASVTGSDPCPSGFSEEFVLGYVPPP